MKIYKVKVNGKTYEVQLEAVEEVKTSNETKVGTKATEVKKEDTNVEGTNVLAPIQGVVININTEVGKKVKKGDVLCFIEAMKLENEVNSPVDGEVVAIKVTKGQSVINKQVLITIK